MTGTWEAQNARIIRDNKTQYFWLRKSNRIIWGPLQPEGTTVTTTTTTLIDLPIETVENNVQ
jgi:hypothetical protein